MSIIYRNLILKFVLRSMCRLNYRTHSEPRGGVAVGPARCEVRDDPLLVPVYDSRKAEAHVSVPACRATH